MKPMTKEEISAEIFRLLDQLGQMADDAYKAHLKASETDATQEVPKKAA